MLEFQQECSITEEIYLPSDLHEYTTPMDSNILSFVNIIPESIPCQRQILQELLDVQMKALNPSQTAEITCISPKLMITILTR
jgi:hypothetical protein